MREVAVFRTFDFESDFVSILNRAISVLNEAPDPREGEGVVQGRGVGGMYPTEFPQPELHEVTEVTVSV